MLATQQSAAHVQTTEVEQHCTCIAAPAAPVLLAKLLESMMTRDESIDMAPAVPPALAVNLARRICTVEFLMFKLPGTPVTSESTNATFNVSVTSKMAALLGDAAETVTPPNLAENLHVRLEVTVCCPKHPLV